MVSWVSGGLTFQSHDLDRPEDRPKGSFIDAGDGVASQVDRLQRGHLGEHVVRKRADVVVAAK